MKKFLSLICAVAITLGAYAAPQFKTKRLAVEKQKFEQNAISAQKQVKPDYVSLKKNAVRAPQAKQAETEEVIDLNFTVSCSKKYYDDTKDWYLVAQNTDYAVSLDLFSNNADNIPTGSFESANFNLEWTGVYDFEVGSTIIKATSAAAEISVSNDTTFILAVLKCNDGKTYRAKFFYADPKLKEPVEVAIATFTATDYDTDMYYTLKNAAGDSIFYFDIYKAESEADVTLDSLYVLSDMMASYSFMKFNGTNVSYYSAEFKKTKTDGLVRIEATVADKEGNVYHLVYQEKSVEPTGEEVTLAFDSAMNVPQYYNDGAWELTTTQNDTMVAFVYVNNTPASPAGNYTAEDLQASYSGVMFGETYIAFHSGSFSVTETDARIDLKGDMLGKNGVLYHISMFFNKPQAEAKDTITATNMTVNTNYYSAYGVAVFAASDETDSIVMTININGLGADMAGEYIVGTDLNGKVIPVGGEAVEIYSGKVTITVDPANGNIKISGKVLGMNLTEYTLNLTYIKPEPQTYNLAVATATGNYQEANSRIQYTLNSEDGNYRFFFAIYLPEGQTDVESGKTYDFANDMQGNSNASYGMDLSAYTFIDYTEATFVKTVVEDTTTIKVTILDLEGNTWNLSYRYVVPADPTELHLQYDNQTTAFEQAFAEYDITAGEGFINFVASNDSNGYVSLQIFAETLTAGVYEINATKEAGSILASVGVSGGYIQPSFAGIRNANGQFSTANLWFLQVGTLTVADDGSAVLAAKNSYGIDVKATFKGALPPHLQYDENADFIKDFASYKVDTTDFAKNGSVMVYIYSDTVQAQIVFFSAATTLAAGEYPVNATGETGTVKASQGYDEEVGIDPSYFATVSGQYLDKLWYLVGGKVTVQEDGTIVVDAVNSLGKAIKATLNVAKEQAIDHVNVSGDATKRLVNGQLVIEKNGVLYNTLGITIK